MPEYLAPGVYVEETSFRSKSIEGVSTSTAGFAGPARFGPISGDPELLTSLADFERIYGALDDLAFDEVTQHNYLAYAVKAFFDEGGKRCYVTRVYNFGAAGYGLQPNGVPRNHAANSTELASPGPPDINLIARFPGEAGNMRVTFTLRVGANAFNPAAATGPALTRVQDADVVHVRDGGAPLPGRGDGLFVAHWDRINRRWLLQGNGADLALGDLPTTAQVRVVTVVVEIERPANTPTGFGPFELQGEFGFDARSSAGLTTTFVVNPPTRLEALTIPFAIVVPDGFPTNPDQDTLAVARELLGGSIIGTLYADNVPVAQRQVVYPLQGGKDGAIPNEPNYTGIDPGFADFQGDPTFPGSDTLHEPKNGLLAFQAVEDISIVAAPGYSDHPVADERTAIQNALINHCEDMRYRIAVLDTPKNQLVSGALDFRNKRSSKYAALYYPWITILDPATGDRLNLPPSGFVAGIYARNDIEHAVFKAPANEVVRSAIDFEQRLNKAQQEVLNPEGVNCFRYFDGRGFLLWGARTVSDDPEWKYVNLRRYFAYLEHSIDRGTQWVVFENNSRQLWDNVRHTIEDFLLNEWKMGGLVGDKPEQAYFVRCDLSTMTQNDLDNGRLICLIGVAPVRPAEFVIFRIGQWTASRPA